MISVMKMLIIYGIIVFLLIYFIYLIVKYSGIEKPEYTLQYFRDYENVKYPTIVVGFLNNKTIKEEHFIATALDFARQGYIRVEKNKSETDYIFTIIKKIKATALEGKALQIFFNSQFLEVGYSQSLNQFKKIMKTEKIWGQYGRIKRGFNSEIREYFDNKQEIKKITKSTNIKNIALCYILFLIAIFALLIDMEGISTTTNLILPIFFESILAFFLFIIAITFIKSSILGGSSYLTSIVITSFFLNTLFLMCAPIAITISFILAIMAIIILFDDIIQRKKTNLANACEMIKGLKQYIIDYSNIENYDIYNIYLWDKYYVYAVALNIKKI